MELYSALGIDRGDVVAFAGAGGKSSAIVAIASELEEAGTTVLVAPTTKMFLEEVEKVGPLATSEDPEELYADTEEAFGKAKAVVAGSSVIAKERIAGLDPSWFPALAKLADVVLVEADGARRRPLKGTADHEPLLPEAATLVIAVGNVNALGMPLDEEHVHRPEIFGELTGVGPGHSVTAEAMARALAKGSLARVPDGARRAVLLTGVEPGRLMSDAHVVARELWRLGIQNVVLCSLSDSSPAQVWIP